MITVQHDSPAAFLAACGKWLEDRDVRHHGLLSLADALSIEGHIHKPPFFFLHAEDGAEVAGCAIFAEPDGLTVSEMTAEAIDSLFGKLRHVLPGNPSRVFGPRHSVREIAKRFAEVTGAESRLHSSWNVHVLDKVPNWIPVKGQYRNCHVSDQELVRAWAREYAIEKPATLDIEEFFIRKLENGHAYFWFDEVPRSVLTISGVNCSGVRISSVYTPPEYRGRGYASSLVAEATTRLLGQEKLFVTLSTETGDPVSKLYERLGYAIVGEVISVVLTERSQS